MAPMIGRGDADATVRENLRIADMNIMMMDAMDAAGKE
jgi:hypothetical protein